MRPVTFENCPRTLETIMCRTAKEAELWRESIAYSAAPNGSVNARAKTRRMDCLPLVVEELLADKMSASPVSTIPGLW
jgi:hypothetical protein